MALQFVVFPDSDEMRKYLYNKNSLRRMTKFFGVWWEVPISASVIFV